MPIPHFHLHITISSFLPLTTIDIFQNVQNFVTEKKIGEVMWMNEAMKQMHPDSYREPSLHCESIKMVMGIVMQKETASDSMEKIKKHLGEMGITEVGFIRSAHEKVVMPLRSVPITIGIDEKLINGFHPIR